jgi:hypothetical protein
VAVAVAVSTTAVAVALAGIGHLLLVNHPAVGLRLNQLSVRLLEYRIQLLLVVAVRVFRELAVALVELILRFIPSLLLVVV